MQDNSKNIEPINFIFGGGLLAEPEGNQSVLKKNRPGVGVGVAPKFGPNDKRFFVKWL